ncbi:MAG: hypothetical protein SGI96_01960 [Bacteroidota bacterium]|nr:hypothetical protein [Saprospiraceae bacterium]MDZ4807016.1 hypothetical protein [Bacteroidota bacterium]
MKDKIRDTALWIGMLFMATLIGATIYQSIVIVPSFSRDIPNGMIEFARGPFQTKAFWTSPIMPIGFLISILALILNWKTPRKKWLLLSLSLAALGEVLTVIVVFLQLKIMGLLDGNPSSDTVLLISTIRQWIGIDYLRFFILGVPSFFLYLKAMTVRITE